MSVSVIHSNGRCRITLEDHGAYRLDFPCTSYSDALDIKRQFEQLMESVGTIGYDDGYRDGQNDAELTETESNEEGYQECKREAIEAIKALGDSDTIDKQAAIDAIQELDP
jgi:hypothetical protein